MNSNEILELSKAVAISSPNKDITEIIIATTVMAIVMDAITEEEQEE